LRGFEASDSAGHVDKPLFLDSPSTPEKNQQVRARGVFQICVGGHEQRRVLGGFQQTGDFTALSSGC